MNKTDRRTRWRQRGAARADAHPGQIDGLEARGCTWAFDRKVLQAHGKERTVPDLILPDSWRRRWRLITLFHAHQLIHLHLITITLLIAQAHQQYRIQ